MEEGGTGGRREDVVAEFELFSFVFLFFYFFKPADWKRKKAVSAAHI